MFDYVQRHYGRHNRSKALCFMILSQETTRYRSIRQIYDVCMGLVPLKTLKNSLPKWSGYRHPYFKRELRTIMKRHIMGPREIVIYKPVAKLKHWVANIPPAKKREYQKIINDAIVKNVCDNGD